MELCTGGELFDKIIEAQPWNFKKLEAALPKAAEAVDFQVSFVRHRLVTSEKWMPQLWCAHLRAIVHLVPPGST